MNRLHLCSLILISLLMSCSNQYSFRDLSSFSIDTAALAENELVEVIYVSGGPDYNNKNEYLYHYMVISQRTGDTVNLLSPFLMPDLSEDNRTYNFIPYHSSSGKVLMKSLVESIGGESAHLPHVDSLVLPDINKVVVNSEFATLANNRHPAILGFLGRVSNAATAE